MCLEVTNAVQIEREIGSHIYSNDYGFRKEQGDSLRDRISTEKTRWNIIKPFSIKIFKRRG